MLKADDIGKRAREKEYGVGVLGIPFDAHSSYLRGPADAPAVIEPFLLEAGGNAWAENGVNLGEEGRFGYLGALGDADTGYEETEEAVGHLLAADTLPLVIGGDHSITYPVMRAIHDAHGPVHILHIDAHADIYDAFQGNPKSHASPFARIMENSLARSLTQVGIRTLTPDQREQIDRFGVNCIEMKNFSRWNRALPEGLTYLSIDLDGLDPAFAPGVSHCEPGGLSVRDVLGLIMSPGLQIVGADIVEYHPGRDIAQMTAYSVGKLVREIAGCMLAGRNR